MQNSCCTFHIKTAVAIQAELTKVGRPKGLIHTDTRYTRNQIDIMCHCLAQYLKRERKIYYFCVLHPISFPANCYWSCVCKVVFRCNINPPPHPHPQPVSLVLIDRIGLLWNKQVGKDCILSSHNFIYTINNCPITIILSHARSMLRRQLFKEIDYNFGRTCLFDMLFSYIICVESCTI